MGEQLRVMDMWGHINELRSRLLRALIALVVTTALSFIFAEQLVEFLAGPVGGTQAMVSIEVTENISVFMKVSLLSGFILAFPFILYQILGFVLPGLTKKEQRWVLSAIPLATLLFAGGVAFTFFVMLPVGIDALMNFLSIRTEPRPNNYFSFITNLMFWVGISFEAPLFVFVLARLHFISAGMLIRGWRIAIVVCAVLAAVITPTGDPVNMGLLMLPLFLLYLLSILFARIAWPESAPRKEKKKTKKDYNKSARKGV